MNDSLEEIYLKELSDYLARGMALCKKPTGNVFIYYCNSYRMEIVEDFLRKYKLGHHYDFAGNKIYLMDTDSGVYMDVKSGQ